jgi:hypothetical protein
MITAWHRLAFFDPRPVVANAVALRDKSLNPIQRLTIILVPEGLRIMLQILL